MEAMLTISLNSYCLKLAKTVCLSYLLCSLFNKIGEQQGRTGSVWKWGVGWREEVSQTMYTHVSECKNDKIKEGENAIYKPDGFF
jgi:hypothetical protein